MGKLIVLDGLDGSGKTTQFEMVGKRLEADGKAFKAISFPDYENPSSTAVKMYLNGEIAKNAEEVNAYAASSFYAVDRYICYKQLWEKDYLADIPIIASRYVSSNAIHQMVKLPESEWEGYLNWLSDYEYVRLGLPKADKVILLDMPVEVSQRLMTARYDGDERKKDIHEANVAYLRHCRKSSYYAAEKLGWEIIECAENDEALPREVIFEKIIRIVYEVLD